MINELILLLQIFLITIFTFASFKLGKNALIMLISLQAVIANLFVLKQINLFGLNATCADAFVIGSILGINLLQEYHGKEIVDKTVNITFFAMLFYMAVSFVHLLYIPSAFDWANNFFRELLQFAPRISIASFASYLISVRFNNFIYKSLENKLNNKYFLFRNLVAIILSQALDTVIFSLLGLYGLVGNLLQIMIVGFTLKLIVILLATPLMSFVKNILKLNNN